MRQITYSQAINEAIDICMREDDSVFVVGEGVPDPKGIFGTTLGLREKYGSERVADMPLSENALTGVCIGAAITGMKPILTHQRMDFTLLAMDQMVNNAAKWHYMFGGRSSVPMVVRAIIGQGWGQGAQHSQSLQALYSHIPGLKVVMPSNAYDAKGLLISSIIDDNPVVFIEHRWLHNALGDVPERRYTVPLGKAKVVREGNDITVAATSNMTIEAIKCSDLLRKIDVGVEVVDVRTIKPFDNETIISSVEKTGRLLVLDSSWNFCGVAGEIIARIAENSFHSLRVPPQRITLPDLPTPTSMGLTEHYYPNTTGITRKILSMVGRDESEADSLIEKGKLPHDVPDEKFKGPF